MSRLLRNKLNHLLSSWPNGVVLTTVQLSERGFYRQLVSKYYNSGWIKKIGYGAYIKIGDKANWLGGLYTLQNDLNFSVHIGGLTALELHGLSHNIPLNAKKHIVYLFNTSKDKKHLPKWFEDGYKKELYFSYVQCHLFTKEIGFDKKTVDGINVSISSPERAILEFLYSTINKFSFPQICNLVENLRLLRPNLLQDLLTCCTSIKTKRLFLYLADKYQLPSFAQLDLHQMNLGKGKIVVARGGMYINKFQISVPKNVKE